MKSNITPVDLKAAFFALLGEHPVIHIDEYRSDDYPDTYNYGDYADFFLDMEKIELVDEGSLNYVIDLLEGALRQVTRNPTVPYRTSTTASRKYSFGDTHDWWKPLYTDNTRDRVVIELEIAVHS